jgi:hypothetical protein
LTAIIIDLRWNPMRAAWRTSPAPAYFKAVHVTSLPGRSLITIHAMRKARIALARRLAIIMHAMPSRLQKFKTIASGHRSLLASAV